MLFMCELRVSSHEDPNSGDWMNDWDYIPIHVDEKVERYIVDHGDYRPVGTDGPSWTFTGEDIIDLDDYMEKFYQRPFLTPDELDLPDWCAAIAYVLTHIPVNRGVTVLV
jgi:hypothetical protein